MESPDLAALLPSWQVALRAERKSPRTLRGYTEGVVAYLRWCDENGQPAVMDRRQVSRFTDDLLVNGAKPATATARQMGVRRFCAWLAAEGELDTDPLLGMKSPKLDQQVVEPLTEDELRALLKACAGKDLRARRDEAILRFMMETGARAGEVAALQVDDVDPVKGTAVVRRGKGGKGRVVPFGPQTALAMDRYLRVRRTHKLAASSVLWLGDRGRGLVSYHGIRKALKSRADKAGVTDFHPHRLRHTAAHRWLSAGGSEGGLMAVAGWSNPQMLMRYTRAQASARAADEARRLNLGDL